MSPILDVRESAIHGRGLFAARFIPEGTVLGAYDGPIVDEDGPHVLWVWHDDDSGMYGIDGQNELRYVNHSAAPNVEFSGAELVALRDIHPGEELTHHYGEGWF
ncbi:MAG: SET domain-containing protein [Planctomycetota bacterium]|jgi:SET domain-containing protein